MECSGCSELFNNSKTTSLPISLPCGYCICYGCANRLFVRQEAFFCPRCSYDHFIPNPQSLLINQNLLNSSYTSIQQKSTIKNELSYNDYIHNSHFSKQENARLIKSLRLEIANLEKRINMQSETIRLQIDQIHSQTLTINELMKTIGNCDSTSVSKIQKVQKSQKKKRLAKKKKQVKSTNKRNESNNIGNDKKAGNTGNKKSNNTGNKKSNNTGNKKSNNTGNKKSNNNDNNVITNNKNKQSTHARSNNASNSHNLLKRKPEFVKEE